MESATIIRERLDSRGRNIDDWTMTVNIGGYNDIKWQIPGRDPETGLLLTEEEVIRMVIALFDERDPELGHGEWRTITARINGKETILTFRGSWIAAFRLERNSARRD